MTNDGANAEALWIVDVVEKMASGVDLTRDERHRLGVIDGDTAVSVAVALVARMHASAFGAEMSKVVASADFAREYACAAVRAALSGAEEPTPRFRATSRD